MSRDGSGAYTLPAGNPVVTNTIINSTVHNNTMSDLASEMTASLAKDGQTILTGALDYNGQKLILDVDGDTSITADTDDQIDIEIAGADDFRIIANIFRALSGSVLEADTINETTAANGVVIDSVTMKDGNVVLGSGNGIDFSATADGTTMSSELLDDYEEGAFTPELWDTSLSGSESQTYATNGQVGRYIKMGRMVYFFCRIEMTSLGSLTTGQQANIGNLPFTSVNVTNAVGTVYAGFGGNLAITATSTPAGIIPINTAYVQLNEWDAATGLSQFTIAELSADGVIAVSGQYEAA